MPAARYSRTLGQSRLLDPCPIPGEGQMICMCLIAPSAIKLRTKKHTVSFGPCGEGFEGSILTSPSVVAVRSRSGIVLGIKDLVSRVGKSRLLAF